MALRDRAVEMLVSAPVPSDPSSVVEHDLKMICDRASDEFTEMSGADLCIVGGGGFLGHYLVQAALAWNHLEAGAPIHVTLADSWARGVPRWVNAIASNQHLTITTLDVTDPIPSEFPSGGWLVHAASIASPTYYRQRPIETMDANVGGLRNLLDHVIENRGTGADLCGLLFFSTSEIYGDPPPDDIPTSETFRGNVSCTGPRACYDESKRYGETLCVNFAAQYDLPVKIVRPFNNYGPGLAIDDRRVIPDFARNILNGDDIVMLSSGSPTRTFCYVADAVVGYFKVLVRGRSGEPYNIGTETPEISMLELAERMAAIARTDLNYRGTVVHGASEDPAYLVDNPDRRCPNIAKARAELGYKPVVSIDEGLRRSLCWYQ